MNPREITDTFNSDGLECPYCGYVNHVEGEDYSENTRVEECSECEKKFHGRQSFSVDHLADPDCELNGEAHEWKQAVHVDGKTGASAVFYRCSKCDMFAKDKP